MAQQQCSSNDFRSPVSGDRDRRLGYHHWMGDAQGVFREVPDEIDESWRHGALAGGMGDLAMRERGALAASFKRAGDVLLVAALAGDEANELLYPILFNYRHAIELYLKAVTEPAHGNHDLGGLIDTFRRVIFERFGVEVPAWILDRLHEFHDVDARSTTFRYPEVGVVFQSGKLQGEVWVDLRRLKSVMANLGRAFARVLSELK